MPKRASLHQKMTAAQLYDLATGGGQNDFSLVVKLLDTYAPQSWALIGGLALNAYLDPLFTADADFIVATARHEQVLVQFQAHGFTLHQKRFWINARISKSALLIQITTDPRYQEFVSRAIVREVLGQPVRVAALSDLFSAKLWAVSDPERRPEKRDKDELDLRRIARSYPEFRPALPSYLCEKL